MRFLRESGRDLEDASLLGLSKEQAVDDTGSLAERVFELLRSGKGEELSQVLLTALVTRATEPAALFDGPVRTAMTRIGHLWEEDHQGIYVEHRATQLLLRVMDQIDALCEPPSDELVAVGGCIDGDQSPLPTRMAATVLASEGIYPVNLGTDTPAAAFLDAAEQIGAQLVWISVSYVSDVARQSEDLTRLTRQLAERGISSILGGREVHRLQVPVKCKAQLGRNMQELATLAQGIRTAAGELIRKNGQPDAAVDES
jgi:methanogenic corrinoid protein MtbC1